MSKEMFVSKSSKKLEELDVAYSTKTTGSDLGVEIFSTIRDEKIAETKKWMVEVMKKASLKHETLVKSCAEAKKINEDVIQYTADGKKLPTFSEQAWKKKTEPFEKLEKLSEQIDKCFSESSVENFKKLENLLK